MTVAEKIKRTNRGVAAAMQTLNEGFKYAYTFYASITVIDVTFVDGSSLTLRVYWDAV